MNPWWLGLAAVEVAVVCGEDLHRLRWEAGELRAVDHDDAEAERTLAALGGQRCACVEFVDAWERNTENLRVLVLASRGPTDPLRPQPALSSGQVLGVAVPAIARAPGPRGLHRRRASAGWVSYGAMPVAATRPGAALEPRTPEEELIELLRLGGGLQHRLIATVAAAWAERCRAPDSAASAAGAQLHAAVYGRAMATVREWLGQDDLGLELRLADGREPPALTREGDVIHAALPFAWLTDVWARGLATVCGRFCLAATTSDGRRWTLSTLSPDLAGPESIVLELPSPGRPTGSP